MIKIFKKVSFFVSLLLMTAEILIVGVITKSQLHGSTPAMLLANKSSAITSMQYFGFIVTMIVMIILAGSSISSEISSGSIKSLIILPVRRWKIFTAKAAALLSSGILMTIFLYVVSMAVFGMMFGEGAPFTYAVNGTTHEISFPIYRLIYVFAGLIDITVISAFAFMLSALIRNTASAIAISLGVYFAGAVSLYSLFTYLLKGEWYKYLPFNNLSFAARIFSELGTKPEQLASYMGRTQYVSLKFSVIYISVLMICMIYTASDSFNRRDIK